mmetsp:Transcript_7110/g.15696  ORF Transcript_7110/g.15696 Transcript_7110/m.15696 type:complete len:252 (-) Transcript_7110:216-971(-)
MVSVAWSAGPSASTCTAENLGSRVPEIEVPRSSRVALWYAKNPRCPQFWIREASTTTLLPPRAHTPCTPASVISQSWSESLGRPNATIAERPQSGKRQLRAVALARWTSQIPKPCSERIEQLTKPALDLPCTRIALPSSRRSWRSSEPRWRSSTSSTFRNARSPRTLKSECPSPTMRPGPRIVRLWPVSIVNSSRKLYVPPFSWIVSPVSSTAWAIGRKSWASSSGARGRRNSQAGARRTARLCPDPTFSW